MTQPTTRATDPGTGAAAYIATLHAALGSRDPFAVLHATPDELRKAIAGLTAAQLKRPEAPGKWSILQVVQHLTHAELVGAFRYRMILAQDQPILVGYDQELWVERLGFAGLDAEPALEEFGLLRRGDLRMLEASSPAQRRRAGLHTERGEESVTQMLRNYAGHDLVHLRQIARIKRAIGEQGGQLADGDA